MYIFSVSIALIKALNIICFDIPYPANYGGAMDVFHKVRWLHKKGIKVYLHCFEYGGRKPAPELEELCEKVFYYKRRTGLAALLSPWPYNVKTRYSEELIQNLLQNDYPIVCEVLHTCYVLADPRFKDRLKIYREVNIEHEYYRHLAMGEKSFVKRLYLRMEARKLERYEAVVKHADALATVSTNDQQRFQSLYPSKKNTLIPCFHEFDTVEIKPGQSDFILYHGNLGVSENYIAAEWLIDNVFSKINYRVIIAGLNPPPFLKEQIAQHKHIELKENCSPQEMNELIANAQIHCLYTQQATGLKLKLLNALYRGRYVVANDAMLAGTSLHKACVTANSPREFVNAIEKFMPQPVSNEIQEVRSTLVADYDNNNKIDAFLNML
ncbi:MAG: glycosyltransferase [Bacteroidetes bacterium]|nr:glycosyltransferase [Bacteroidota bacterium]